MSWWIRFKSYYDIPSDTWMHKITCGSQKEEKMFFIQVSDSLTSQALASNLRALADKIEEGCKVA